jgi:Ser-tRNA(Ala) deacylase AlaX
VLSPDSTWSLEFITLDEFIRLLPLAAVRRNGRAGETAIRAIACDDVESKACGSVC